MPSRNTIEIVINATDNASRVFNSLKGNTETIGALATGALVAGFTAATGAAVVFATKGLQEFTKFQAGMQEVFSLLPGISQDAMDEMNEQVKRISVRFGTLPEEVIPAVYEALSAGIPQDNVFQFVEVANRAAIAGVTDLATAVNGISSAMNAYGYDILDAATASDVMFQTVKLGKTTFEELSNSLYNVSPTAAALGVTFEDLNAQIAAITAQGVPTSVATNQMRQMFVELSKAGGKTADIFQQLAGKTFKQFIAEGGNTQDALQLLEKYAKETGVGINDLFSSVEAGSAALSLTGRNTERFTSFLDQMATSAGSTDAAFKTMSESLQYQMNRTQAKLSVLFINIGEKLAPAFAPLVEEIGNVIGWFADLVAGGTSLEDFISYDLPEAFQPIARIILNLSKEFKRISSIISRFFAGVNAGVPFLDNLHDMLYSLFPKSTADAINFIINGLNKLWQIIKPIADAIIKWVTDNVKLEDVLIAVGIAISSFVIPAIISIGAAIAPVIGTFALLVGAVTLLRKAWENDFLGIRTFVLEKLIPALTQLSDWFLNDALPKAIDFVQNVAIPAFQIFVNWLSGIWETIRPGLESLANWFINDALPAVINFITNTVIPGIGNLVNTLVGIWNIVRPELEKLYNWFVTEALPAVVRFIEGTIIPGIQKLIDLLLGIWNLVKPELDKLFNWFVTEALPSIVNFVETTVIPGVQKFIDLLVGIWDIVSPILGNLADWFLNTALPSIVNFINNTVIPGVQDLIDIIKGIWNSVQTPLNNLKNGMDRIFTWIKTNIIDPVLGRIQEFITTLQNLGTQLGLTQGQIVNTGNGQLGSFNPNSYNAPNVTSTGSFGFANGLPYAPREMGIRIHQGERVLTKQENRDYTANQGNGSPSVVIENVNIGSVNNQDDANRKAEMFVNGLRAQGIDI